MEDLPMTPTTEHIDTQSQKIDNHGQAKMMFLLGAVLVVGAIVAGGFFYFSQATKKIANDSMVDSMQKTYPISEGRNENATVYNNTDYGISFSLYSGEEVTECPTINPTTTMMRLWITGGTDTTNKPDCTAEEISDPVFMSKKSSYATVDDYLKVLGDPENGYALTKSDAIVSGKTVQRITGQKITPPTTGLPETIDTLVFSQNGILYAIPASYLQRNLQVK